MTTRQSGNPGHDAAERFIAGEDRLSALLRDVPRFEAPASLASAVATAARAVQARMAAEAERDAVRTSAPPPTFGAPPTLSDSVLREAARLQAAQAARRDVVFDQVLRGKPADDVLGAPVSAPTEAWLRTQAAQHRDGAASTAAVAPPPARRATAVSRWWRSLGVAATAFAVAGLATRIVLSQLDDGTPMTASLSSNVVIADDAGPATRDEPGLASAPASGAAPAMAAPAAEDAQDVQTSAAAPERAAPQAAPVHRPTTPSLTARKAHAPSTAPAAATAESTPAAPAAPAAPAILAAPPPMASAQAPTDAAPAPAPAPGVGAEARARRVPQSAYMAAPAPAPAESPAASKATGQAAVPEARKSATVTLEDDPASVAMQWRPGKGLHVWSAEPDNAAVRDWVARLWAAMPADARPVAPYGIQRDDALARGQLRIEQGTEPPGVN
ncbi:hypothetical protein D9X30_2654 [Cupriavidus sp. U2]|uniref:hypothetical protein n=1 Tax=Cupriavidus sp. U2 TaxID=2920269 RepID=UPI00129EA915|nr:hypothetical protein [Cupriavidus sp. U2]KAI3592917.1 hypothetical protein D9X30_2654 [Cupriavidus sp. U2]